MGLLVGSFVVAGVKLTEEEFTEFEKMYCVIHDVNDEDLWSEIADYNGLLRLDNNVYLWQTPQETEMGDISFYLAISILGKFYHGRRFPLKESCMLTLPTEQQIETFLEFCREYKIDTNRYGLWFGMWDGCD